jgi:hypothetical protein
MAFPVRFAKGDTFWQNRLAQIAAYDPAFDTTDYNARAKTRADYSNPGSRTGQSIVAANTMIQHLEKVKGTAEALNNANFTPYNMLTNPVEKLFGDPRVTNFTNARDRFSEEATRFYRNGAGNEADITRNIRNLNENMSPAQIHGAVDTNLDLFLGRTNELRQQWRDVMGPMVPEFPVLSPDAQAAIGRMRGTTGTTGTSPASSVWDYDPTKNQ